MHTSTYTPAKWSPRTPARFIEVDPRDEDTIELELTPDQLRELEQAAEQAFSRRGKELPQPAPRATVISTPQANTSHAAAPIIVMSAVARIAAVRPAKMAEANRGVGEAEVIPPPASAIAKADAPPVKTGAALRALEPSATDACSCSPAQSDSSGALPAPGSPARSDSSEALPAPGSPARSDSSEALPDSGSPALAHSSEGLPASCPPMRTQSSSQLPTSWRARHKALVVAIAISVPAFVAAAVIHLSASHPSTQPQPEPASAVERTPLPPAPGSNISTRVSPPATDAAELPIANPPVTFANPFDRSEVFEFPPGTTRAEARDAVAQLLIERARERRNR